MAAKPRWLAKIVEALALPENKGKIVYQVATVDTQHVPHVRTQVHRGFIIPKNAPSLPLLVTSCDVRSPKVVQMMSNTSVEIAWWMEGSQDQFRISGKVGVIPPPDNAFHDMTWVSQGIAGTALNEGGEAEREDGGDGRFGDAYDWEKKRKEVFDAMRPGMKGTWCAPKAPGSRLSSYDELNEWSCQIPNLKELKTDEDKRNYQTALSNFAMLVIEPLKVDWVQLALQPNRRTLFVRKDEDEGSCWTEQVLVP